MNDNSLTTPAPQADTPILVDAKAAAAMLGISRTHLFALKASGRLPAPIRLGRAIRWNRETLIQWCMEGCPPPARFEARGRSETTPKRGRI